MKVYLDNGATTKVDTEVVKAMLPYFTEKYGNASSAHYKGQEAKRALDDSRRVIAKKINAKFEEIIFNSGGSESDNMIKKIAFSKGKKGNIITSKIEHPAVLESCKFLERLGFTVTYLNVDKSGYIDLNELENSIKKNTILVSIIHGNNEIGTIQDLRKIGEICKKHKVLFHTDAVQSFCKTPINVKKDNIDLISLSAHKLHGPKGVGALFVRKGIKVKLINGGHQEFDKRAGTENIPGIIGFAKAVQLYNDKEINKIKELRDYLINGILKIKDVKLNGPKERLCNNVNVSFKYIEGESLGAYLDANGICTSTGSACSSQSLEPSHVLTAIGLTHEEAHGSLRLTLGRFNTKEEIDYVLKILPKYVEKLRKISPLHKLIRRL